MKYIESNIGKKKSKDMKIKSKKTQKGTTTAKR
jgi:hypothetical protein